jgi:hypothetical protein
MEEHDLDLPGGQVVDNRESDKFDLVRLKSLEDLAVVRKFLDHNPKAFP